MELALKKSVQVTTANACGLYDFTNSHVSGTKLNRLCDKCVIVLFRNCSECVWHSTVIVAVLHIFRMSSPNKIADVVVAWIAIKVAALHVIGARSNNGVENNVMNKDSFHLSIVIEKMNSNVAFLCNEWLEFSDRVVFVPPYTASISNKVSRPAYSRKDIYAINGLHYNPQKEKADSIIVCNAA